MKNAKSMQVLKNCIMQAVLITGIMSVPGIARPNQLWDFTTNRIPQGTSRTEQAQLMETARTTFEKAVLVGGEKAAPYEYYMAQELLALAEEEFRAGDKIGVSQFAAESRKYSSLAQKMAEGGLQ